MTGPGLVTVANRRALDVPLLPLSVPSLAGMDPSWPTRGTGDGKLRRGTKSLGEVKMSGNT